MSGQYPSGYSPSVTSDQCPLGSLPSFSMTGRNLGWLPLRYRSAEYLRRRLFCGGQRGGLWIPGLDTCWKDTSGISPCTAPGDLVARINDLSGHGHHAIQATTAARPALGRTVEGERRNLHTNTEAFESSYWRKLNGTISANTADTTAPDGTNTADKFTATATDDQFSGPDNTSGLSSAGVTFSHSVFIKAGNRSTWKFRIYFYTANSLREFTFTFATGAFSDVSSGLTVSSENKGNGWWRVMVTTTTPASTTNTVIQISCYKSLQINDYAYFWGAQVELGSSITPYQRVGSTVLDVTESGKGELWYLKNDGVDDSLSATFTSPMGIECTTNIANISSIATLNNQNIANTYNILQGNEVFGAIVTYDALSAAEQNQVNQVFGTWNP